MSGVTPSSSNDPVFQTQAAESTDGKSKACSGNVPSSTVIKGLEQLRDLCPEVYDEMLKAMADDINKDSTKSLERIKKLNRESYQQ